MTHIPSIYCTQRLKSKNIVFDVDIVGSTVMPLLTCSIILKIQNKKWYEQKMMCHTMLTMISNESWSLKNCQLLIWWLQNHSDWIVLVFFLFCHQNHMSSTGKPCHSNYFMWEKFFAACSTGCNWFEFLLTTCFVSMRCTFDWTNSIAIFNFLIINIAIWFPFN